MRLAPSATSSSSVVDSSASATSSTCTLSIGVPSSPAFHRQRLFVVFKEEGTSRLRSGGASTSSGYNSPFLAGSLETRSAHVCRVSNTEEAQDLTLEWVEAVSYTHLRAHETGRN